MPSSETVCLTLLGCGQIWKYYFLMSSAWVTFPQNYGGLLSLENIYKSFHNRRKIQPSIFDLQKLKPNQNQPNKCYKQKNLT